MPSVQSLRFLYRNNIGGQAVLDKLNQLAKPERKRLGCVVTGNKSWLNRKWKLSRHEFRKQALAGELHGVHKALW